MEIGLWTEISVVIFFTMFLFLLFWVFRRGGRKGYDAAAQLPFEE